MESLICPGGGARFAIQAGVLRKLYLAEYQPDAIFGNSAGSLAGIIYATGQADSFYHICATLSNSKIKDKRRNLGLVTRKFGHWLGIADPPEAKYSNAPLFKLVKHYVLGKECKIHYECAVVEMGDNSPNRYLHHVIKAGQIITERDCKFILASTAIPGVFDLVEIDGKTYADGGVLHNNPVNRAIANHSIDSITFILTAPMAPQSTKKERSLFGRSLWALTAMMQSTNYKDMDLFMRMNQVARMGCLLEDYNPTYIKGRLFEPDLMGEILDFSSTQAIELYRHGFSLNPKQIG